MLREIILGLLLWVKSLFRPNKAHSMAIVRRYTDANGAFVGELYLLGSFAGILGYQQVGMSLDTLPFDTTYTTMFILDVENDFLMPMPEGCVRIGAQLPEDNEAVRASIRRIAREGSISLQVQNRFCEHVLGKGKGT